MNHPEYQFCVYDNRGSGRSTSNLWRSTTSLMASDALKLLDFLGSEWNRPHVVGVSMGGMISQELTLLMIANERPPKSLTLCVTHAGRSFTPIKGVASTLRSLFASTPEDKITVFMDALYSQTFLNSDREGKNMREFIKEAYLDRVSKDVPTTFGGFVSHLFACTTHHVSEDRLRIIKDSKTPILIVTGGEDHMVPHSNSEYLKNILEPAEYIFWEGVGHGVTVERFHEFNESIVRNLQRGESQ
eukprot:TRINITY_DN3076_c0_g1_i1.p1 TRINITY_DN3076_c0_g1~~TRINITY_DN3076_c0_g1_i1.p1  ORF type:complete len:244 (+),score=85.31 TRINITY_DN3076_c0_g1_i1:203-934(+)